MEENNKPVRSCRAGGISIAVWEKNGFESITFKKSYKNDEDEWKETQNINHNDIPKLILCLEHEYKQKMLKKSS